MMSGPRGPAERQSAQMCITRLEAEVERLRQTLFTAEDEILRMGKLYQRDCQGRLYVRLQVENAELKAKVKRLKPYEQYAKLKGAK